MDSASFRFNFGGDAAPALPLPDLADAAADLPPACEVKVDLSAAFETEEVLVGSRRLLKARAQTVSAATAAFSACSDLLPGRYEGGLKLWECALDLCAFLEEGSCPPLTGASVLELGAGHGLPGVTAALLGAEEVAFQDFNEAVLHAATAPAVAANLPGNRPRLRFFAGDWGALQEAIPGGRYHLILSSDTVYSPSATPRLLALIIHALQPSGVALIAAKTFYFGVGGGTRDFAALAEAGGFAVRSVASFRDGVSNVREILWLQRPPIAGDV